MGVGGGAGVWGEGEGWKFLVTEFVFKYLGGGGGPAAKNF